MDVIYNELWLTVIDKRAPIYGPFLMKLIRKKYFDATKEDIMKDGLPIVKHPVKELRVKKHDPPTVPSGEPSEPPVSRVGKRATASASLGVEPSWFKQFKEKAKKAFCFNQDRAYEAHVFQKKSTKRQKDMMRSMNLKVSPPGSEENITPEAAWKVKHGYWSDSDIPTSSTHQGQDEE